MCEGKAEALTIYVHTYLAKTSVETVVCRVEELHEVLALHDVVRGSPPGEAAAAMAANNHPLGRIAWEEKPENAHRP